MKQLLNIQTIPISLKYNVNPGGVKRRSATTDLQVTRDRKGLQIKNEPAKLRIDTFEARSSYMQTTKQSIEKLAQKGSQAASEATARYAQEGNMLLDLTEGSDPLKQIIASRSVGDEKQFNLGFIPATGPNIQYIPGDFQMHYEMDKLNFNWHQNPQDFDFTKADIDFTVMQYPKVEIRYVGDPIYVPRSANSNRMLVNSRA